MVEVEQPALHEYFSTVGSGLEQFCSKELLNLGSTYVGEVIKGKVFFSSRLPMRKLISLKTSERLFLLVLKQPQFLTSHPKRKAILVLRDLIESDSRSKLDLSLKKWRDFHPCFPCPNLDKLSFRVSCKSSGEIRRVFPPAFLGKIIAGSLLNMRRKWTTDLRNPQLEVLVHANVDSIIIGLACCPMNFPLSKRSYLPSSTSNTILRPTICFAMLDCGLSRYKEKLSQASEGFKTLNNFECNKQPLVILDPMCGSGMILAEAAYSSQDSKYNLFLLGSDIDEKQVRLASQNIVNALNNSREEHEFNPYYQCISNLFVADARALPLNDNSIDIIISDIPFGLKHYGDPWKKESTNTEIMENISEAKKIHQLKSFNFNQVYGSEKNSAECGTISLAAYVQETHSTKSITQIRLGPAVEKKERDNVATTEPFIKTDNAGEEIILNSYKRRKLELNQISDHIGVTNIRNMLPNLVAELDRVLKNGGQSVLLISENLKSDLLEAVNTVTKSYCVTKYCDQASDISNRNNLTTVTSTCLSENKVTVTNCVEGDNIAQRKNRHGWVCIEQHTVKLGILDAVICVFNK